MTPRTYRPSRLDRALWSFQMVILVVFVVRSIRDAIATTEGIAGIRELRTIHIGPDDLVVAAGVWVDATRTATAISHSIDTAERRVGEIAPFRTIISIEPRVRDPAPPPTTSSARHPSCRTCNDTGSGDAPLRWPPDSSPS